MYQLGNLLAKELCDCIKMCMYVMCGMSENKYKQPKFIENSAEDSIYYRLVSMIDEGRFNEAENTMYECLNMTNIDDCYVMLCVYDYMNEFEDEFIEENDYSREEIKEGIEFMSRKQGMDSLLFLYND